jgi:hypothetical protein
MAVERPLHSLRVCNPPDLGAEANEVFIRPVFRGRRTAVRASRAIILRTISEGIGVRTRGQRRRRVRARQSIILGSSRRASRAITITAFTAVGLRVIKGRAKLILTIGWRVKLNRGLVGRVRLLGAAWRAWYTEAITDIRSLLESGLLPGLIYHLSGSEIELSTSRRCVSYIEGAVRGTEDIVALRYEGGSAIVQCTASKRLFYEVTRGGGASRGRVGGGRRVGARWLMSRRGGAKAFPGLALALWRSLMGERWVVVRMS